MDGIIRLGVHSYTQEGCEIAFEMQFIASLAKLIYKPIYFFQTLDGQSAIINEGDEQHVVSIEKAFVV
jgi:hypothetical protein